MAIYETKFDWIEPITPTTFGPAGVRERHELQRLQRQRVDIVPSDTLIIAEEFGEWDESKRRIDLLGIDKEANLVVIELNRTVHWTPSTPRSRRWMARRVAARTAPPRATSGAPPRPTRARQTRCRSTRPRTNFSRAEL